MNGLRVKSKETSLKFFYSYSFGQPTTFARIKGSERQFVNDLIWLLNNYQTMVFEPFGLGCLGLGLGSLVEWKEGVTFYDCLSFWKENLNVDER